MDQHQNQPPPPSPKPLPDFYTDTAWPTEQDTYEPTTSSSSSSSPSTTNIRRISSNQNPPHPFIFQTDLYRNSHTSKRPSIPNHLPTRIPKLNIDSSLEEDMEKDPPNSPKYDYPGSPLDSIPSMTPSPTHDPDVDRMHSRTSSTSSSLTITPTDTLCCRICREEGTMEMPLYTPCKCTGSIQHVHQSCLLEWLTHSGRSEQCEVCGELFTFVAVYARDMPTRLPLLIILQSGAFAVLSLLLRITRVTVVLHIWFMGVPALIGWSIQKLFSMIQSPNILVAGNSAFGPQNKPRLPIGHYWVPNLFPTALIEWQLLTIMTMFLAMFVLFVRDWLLRIYREAMVADAWHQRMRQRHGRAEVDDVVLLENNEMDERGVDDEPADPFANNPIPPPPPRPHVAQPQPDPAIPAAAAAADQRRPVVDDDAPMPGGIDDMLGLAGPIDQGLYAMLMALVVLSMSVIALQWSPFLVGCAFLALRPVHWLIVLGKICVQVTDMAADYVALALSNGPTMAWIKWTPNIHRLLTPLFQHGANRYRDSILPIWLVRIVDAAENVHYIQLNSWAKRYTVMALGWLVASGFFALWAYVWQNNNMRAKLAGVLIRRALRSMTGTAKLVLFIVIEWLFFPAYTGILVHIIIQPVMSASSSATLVSHWQWAQQSPGSAFMAHWIMGANVMFYQSSFVQASRQILRPGVLWFVRDVSDPDFSPYTDIAAKSLRALIRKIGLSAFVYTVVTVITTVAIRSVLSVSIGVLRTPNVPLISAPIDIVIMGAASPWIAGRLPVFEIAQWILLVVLDVLGRALRLRSFLFGGFHVDETDSGSGVKNLFSRVLQAIKEPKQQLTRPPALPQAGLGRDHPTLVDARRANNAHETNLLYKQERKAMPGSSGMYRVPAYDMVPVDHEPKQMLFLVDMQGVDIADLAPPNMMDNRPLNQDHWTYVYLPPRFTLRWISLLLGVVLMLGVFIGLVIGIPIRLGRRLFPWLVYSVMHLDQVVLQDRVHDVYAWILGMLLGAVCSLVVIQPLRDLVLWRNHQRPRFGWIKVLSTWMYVITLAGIAFPIIVGRMLAVLLNATLDPARLDVVPTIVGHGLAWQWCVGIVVLQLALFTYENADPNGPIMNRIARAFPNGHPNFRRVNNELMYPIMSRLIPIYLVHRATLLMLSFVDTKTNSYQKHSVHATLLIAFSFGCVYLGRQVWTSFSLWLQSVRDREYRVTRVLQNRHAPRAAVAG